MMASVLPYLAFEATPDSNLDPLINALELYVISNSGGNGTNSTSRSGGSSPSTGGGGGSSPNTSGGRGSPSTGGSGGGKSDSSSSSLALPLGISFPSLLVLGAGGWGVWTYFIKPRRNPESEMPLKQNINVQVNVGNNMGNATLNAGK